MASDVDPEAQAYFRGRYEYDRGTQEGYRAAMQYFEDALKEDPDFALALAGMAGARFLGALENGDVSGEALMQSYGEAETALALDSTWAQTREVFALIERSLPRLTADAPAPLSARTPSMNRCGSSTSPGAVTRSSLTSRRWIRSGSRPSRRWVSVSRPWSDARPRGRADDPRAA